MRKAFDANVPKLKPRLRTAALDADSSPPSAPGEGEGGGEEIARAVQVPRPVPLEGLSPEELAARQESLEGCPRAEPVGGLASPGESAAEAPQPPPARARTATGGLPEVGPGFAGEAQDDVLTRRDRLDKIRRKVAEAARPAPPRASSGWSASWRVSSSARASARRPSAAISTRRAPSWPARPPRPAAPPSGSARPRRSWTRSAGSSPSSSGR